jgi:hypothetical protein
LAGQQQTETTYWKGYSSGDWEAKDRRHGVQ